MKKHEGKEAIELFSLDKNGGTPYHEQILNQIRQSILSSVLHPGDKLPSESAFTTHLEISRNTIRQALLSAENEGLLERIVGKGSYVRDHRARSSTLDFVGYVVSNFLDDSHREMIVASESLLRNRGYSLMFASSQGHFHDEFDIVTQFVQQGAAGIIVWPSPAPADTQFYQQLYDQRVPLVFLDRLPRGVTTGDVVTSDNRLGGRLATEYLLGRGHRRIRFLTAPSMGIAPAVERYQGYSEASEEAGLSPAEPLILQTGKPEFSVADLQEWLTTRSSLVRHISRAIEESGATGFFCVNDATAILLQESLRLAGSTNDGIDVVGFDGTQFAAFSAYRFATIAQDFSAIGRIAAERLLWQMNGGTDLAVHRVPVELRLPS